jgi:hypothetical protein
MTRKLLQQALDALQWHYDKGYPDSPTDEPRKRDARAIRALRSALAAPQPEPSDMVMVPKQPTPEMRRAGVALHQKHTGHLSEVITAVYRAMIAAAPAPAVPEGAMEQSFKDKIATLVPEVAPGWLLHQVEIQRRTYDDMRGLLAIRVVLRAALRSESAAPAVPLTDTRKLCTCDGAGRGPGRACVVQAGGRLGDLWRCAHGIGGGGK